MVIENSLARWQLVRAITDRKGTGTLTVQYGPRYFNWQCENGQVVAVTSSSRDDSFGVFVKHENLLASSVIDRASAEVNDEETLGMVLMEHGVADAKTITNWLKKHWVVLSRYMFDPMAHLFWSQRDLDVKEHSVLVRAPLSELLLQVDRSCIGIVPAVRFAQETKGPYTLLHFPVDLPLLADQERRIIRHVRIGSSVTAMLHDPEVDRMTCYRTLFLLWVSGCIKDNSRPMRRQKAISTSNSAFWKRVKSIPPDWLFPLAFGLVLGVLLAPDPTPTSSAREPAATRTLKQIVEKPAWRDVPALEEEK